MVKIDDELKKKALLHLCNNDESPNKDIEEGLNVDGSSISRVLVKLESEGYIITKIGKNNENPRSLKRDFPALEKLVLKGTYLRGHVSESTFLQSKYCEWWIPKIVDELTTSFNDLKLSEFDILHCDMTLEEFNRDKESDSVFISLLNNDRFPVPFICGSSWTETGNVLRKIRTRRHKPLEFTEAEKEEIAVTLKSNWSMMRCVVHFLSLDDGEMRRDLMLRIAHDAMTNSPTAIANKTIIDLTHLIHKKTPSDFKHAFSTILATTMGDVLDGDDRWGFSACKRIQFFSLFQQIEDVRRRYPFLSND